jgi:hypothetical protein
MSNNSLKEETCGTCKAYDDQHQGQGQGICKRRAPAFIQMPTQHPITHQRGMIPIAAWPVVQKDMACLDWLPANIFKLDS